MRVAGLLEDPDEAIKLLKAIGWLAYAIDSQGARAPPPSVDPSVPGLPLTSDHDGIAYELEPWEQARRNRLQAYARERDQVAGMVIYDGEWNEANWTPSEATAWPQSMDESQASPFPHELDQRPPNWDNEACQDEPGVPDWNQMPLAKWAAQSNCGDDIDQSPPPEWEAQTIDQSPQCWQDSPLARWSETQDDWDGIDPIPTDHEPVFYTD